MTQRSGPKSEEMLSCRAWIIFFTLPCLTMLLTYFNFSLGGLLPMVQESFGATDAEVAAIATFQAFAKVITFTAMWLLGDFLPKKPTFLLSVTLWILFSYASVMLSSDRFWLFVLLRSLASVFAEIFRILITVLQAQYFTGKYLTAALSANVVGNSITIFSSSIISSIFVANKIEWRIGVIIAPSFAIPLLISFIFTLRKIARPTMSNPLSILRNALGVFKIPSFVLLVIAQFTTMFYSLALLFWSSSMLLNAFEAYPDVFLGLSYPIASSIISVASLLTTMIGAFAMPFLTQMIEGGLFGCLPPTLLAIPIIYAVSVALETLCYIAQVTMIDKSFPLYVTSFAVDGFSGCGVALMQLQLILSSTPANQRTSALSLLQLIIAIGEMPSSQIIGAISDYITGDSTAPQDRLESLQSAFIYTWILPVIATILSFIILRFYTRDVDKAKEIDRMDNEETALLITEKSRVID